MSAHHQVPLQSLAEYLPEGTFEEVISHIREYKVQLTIKRARRSVLGDYRHPADGKGHRITINGNLNRYAFLLTLVHEIAHLLAFTRYGRRIAPHGNEWKQIYSKQLYPFLGRGYLPEDVEAAVKRYCLNPKASSCADDDLMRVLHRYDKKPDNHFLVEDLPEGALFRTTDGRIFKKGNRLRKRYHCIDVHAKRIYLFSPVYEVEKVEENGANGRLKVKG